MLTAAALALFLAPAAHIDPRDCAALVVFSEARSESYLGQALVAQVLVNRSRESGDGLCEEMEREAQFHGVERWPYPRTPWKTDAAAWEQAREIVDAVVMDDYVSVPNECKRAMYFQTIETVTSYSAKLKELCRVGRHVFLVKE